MVKYTVVCPYQGILFSNQKEQTSNIYYNLDETQGNYGECKNQFQKVMIPFI